MAVMAKKKKPSDPAPQPDRHRKPGFQLRLHPALLQQLDILVERNATNRTAEIATALRKYLENEGLWPIKPG